ncbi:hypothetical protein ACFY2W_04000 [Streptomyces sp. NPDC001262]|uniref:hypothetical protein n=1 Tax=Streptomyces sp. NPDC001262 TaxID=3364552 RepID=UPI0036CE4447
MRTHVVHDDDPEDFRALFLGHPDESPEERAARTCAARDVLEELQEHSGTDEITLLNALYAAQLVDVAMLRAKTVDPPQGESMRAA